ncbi:glycosyltransferase family 61 protein [Haloparvum sp. AD34]
MVRNNIFARIQRFTQRAVSYGIRRPIAEIGRYLIKNEIGCKSLERYDLLSLAKENNWEILWPNDGERFELRIPETEDDPPEEIIDAAGCVEFDDPFVLEIPDARLRGKKALLTISNRTFVPEKEADRADLLSRGIGWYIADLVTNRASIPKNHYELAVPLTGPMSHTYFHWFVDYLMRMESVFYYAEKTGKYPTILLPKDSSQWLRDSVKFTGYPQNKIEIWPGGTAKVDQLVLPSSRRRHCPWHCEGFAHYSPNGLEWVSETLRSNSPDIEREWPSVVVISRSDAGTREFSNLDEICDRLRQEGYEIEPVILSDLKLAEQIDLFNSVEVVIGAHGAGLINTVFADRLSVIEIYSELYNPPYYSIADIKDFQYTVLRVEKDGEYLTPDPDEVVSAVKNVVD